MFTKNWKCAAVALVFVSVLGLTSVVNAALIASDVLTDVQGDANASGPYPPTAWQGAGTGYTSVGILFDAPTAGVTVQALGFWDEGGNGLAVPHTVGLFGSPDGYSVTLLASVSVSSGTVNPLELGYRWANLATPLTIADGYAYYLVAATSTEIDGDVWYAVNNTLNPAINVGYSDGRYSTTAWTSGPYPYGGGPLGTANLSTKSVVPEPSVLLLLATGLLSLLAYAWRKRKCVPS